MKKSLFVFLVCCLFLPLGNAAFSQFEGYIEFRSKEYVSKQKSMFAENEEMKEQLKAMKSELDEKKSELKKLDKNSEEAKELAEVIRQTEQSIKQMGGLIGGENAAPKESFVKMYMGKKKFKVLDMGEGKEGQSAIMDIEKKMMWMILDQQKKYIEMSLDFIKQMSEMNKNLGKIKDENKPEKPKSKITKTGEKKTILGFVCEKIISEEEDKIFEAWVAFNFSDLVSSMKDLGGKSFGMNNENGAFEELLGDTGFPFKVIGKSKDGKLLEEFEVLKAEKQTFDKDFFAPPKDYKKADMQELMKMK